MGRGQQDEVDEELDELEHSLKRLRVEYDQYFMGILKRPPEVLQGRVQKVITKYSNQTLRKTHQKFRFNQLNSKFQIHRQQWGRTMRQIEQGTYKGHLFRAKLHERERGISDETPRRAPEPTTRPGAIDKLFEALVAAKRRAGDSAPAPDRAKLSEMVKKQTAALKEKHPGAKVKFRVAIEGNK
ncbi:MAG TPA: MXAN_5187 C-terminal domain-containing protein, partial [Myxococcota bacterium]|nr:MXAN_5187 C-terminal domain-containing protein [Myxococcota bacterium]